MITVRFFGAYFGEPWPSGICDDGTPVPVPVGELCAHCEELITAEDRGTFIGNGVWPERPPLVPVHRECALRCVLGGIGHHLDHDHWCVEAGDPDGGMSYRESALAVWERMR